MSGTRAVAAEAASRPLLQADGNKTEAALTLRSLPAALPRRVELTAPARLHLGFLDMHGGLGRRYGSLGMALQAPVTRLTLTPADDVLVSGPASDRARDVIDNLLRRLQLPGGVHLSLHQAIPAHAGLGSGTQLLLAVATALLRLHGLQAPTVELAHFLARGRRSGIGTAVFEAGGLVIDGGRSDDDAPPPVLCRLPLPRHWRMLLVLDVQRQGLSGEHEEHAVAGLGRMSEATTGSLCRLVLMQLLPALREQHCAAFGAALSEIQGLMGDYFAPVQQGRYSSPVVAEVMQWLAPRAAGCGQSSWGPTGFALFPGEQQAQAAHRAACRRFAAAGLDFLLTAPRNHGADVTSIPP